MTIFYIAEIGINHNGDLKIAKKLIDEAKIAGFNSVKFQKRDINTVYSNQFLDSYRKSPWGKTQREQKNGLELTQENYTEIDKYCKSKKIEWFASAWELKSFKFLEKFNCNYNKIASPMIIDKNFINSVAEQKKYTFISTGMSLYNDIKYAVDTFRKHNTDFELMHCVSVYPMKAEYACLNTILKLKKEFDCKVGYSGHESGLAVSFAATALGITSLERHITLDRSMYGSDQAASLEPTGMRTLISTIKKMKIAINGDDQIGKILDEEIENAKKLRGHIKINNEK